MPIDFAMASLSVPKKWRNSFTASRIVLENTSSFTWTIACDVSTDSPISQATCKLTTIIITSLTTVFRSTWIISSRRSCRFTLSNNSQSVNRFPCWEKVRFHRKAFCRHFLRLHRSNRSAVQSCLEPSAANQCRRHRQASRTKTTREAVGVPGEYSNKHFVLKHTSFCN